MLKVVIADDHRLILAGIKRALEDDGEFEVVGEASTGEQGPAARRADQPRPGRARPAHAGHGRARLPRPDQEAPPRDQGGRALGLDRPEADRERPQARRERLHREERQPGRPAGGDHARRSRRPSTPRSDSPTTRPRAPPRPPGSPTASSRSSTALARGHVERSDREGALGRRADGEVPPDERLPQARTSPTGPRRPATPTSRASSRARCTSTNSALGASRYRSSTRMRRPFARWAASQARTRR